MMAPASGRQCAATRTLSALSGDFCGQRGRCSMPRGRASQGRGSQSRRPGQPAAQCHPVVWEFFTNFPKEGAKGMGRQTRSPPRMLMTALVAFALGTQACGAAAPKRPAPPPAQAQKGPPAPEEQPYHVAPPPAYGNKVVLAEVAEPQAVTPDR